MKLTPLLLQRSALFFCITAFLLALPQAGFAQKAPQNVEESPYVELISTDGAKIEAEIIKVADNSVTIRRKDRQLFTFPLAMLNDNSRKLVQAWAIDQALATSLEIKVRERNLSREKNNTNYSTGDVKTVQMQFTVTNKSATTIDNLRIEYRIYVRREQIGVPNSQFAQEEIIPGKLTLNRLEGGKDTVLEANPAIKLFEEKYHANVIPNQGSNRSSQDKVDGYWYRVYRGKNLITESSTPRRLMQVKEW